MPSAGLLKSMARALAHRGPDGEGFFCAPAVGLAHRRLAVIDPAGGEQPMWDAGGSVVIVFNGEIYNFAAVRAELTALGRIFRTRSDTEVILEAWNQWGEDCLKHLHGQFALALWDEKRQVLFLARDRLGEKPLYYSVLPDGEFLFASEMNAMLVHPGLSRAFDPCAVEEFFALGYVAEPRTIYGAVSKLPPGHSLTLRRSARPAPSAYWDVAVSRSRLKDLDQAAQELAQRLENAVAAQQVADVPIGAFVSGGVDSGLVTAMMARQSSAPINCFTIGFKDPAFDESIYAAQVAERYGAKHHVEYVTGEEEAPAANLAAIFGEPFGDSSALPTLRVMRLARKHVTVALSGDGGDELFAGYRRYGFHAREESLRGMVPGWLRAPVFGVLAQLYPQADWAPRPLRARQTFLELSCDTAAGYFANVSVMDDKSRQRLYAPALKRDLQGYSALSAISRHFAAAPFEDAVARAQYVDLKTWLPGDILTKVDRTAMACSLEVRVPMLDADLVEWALNVPDSIKRAGGEGKAALKRAAHFLLPKNLLSRPKQGFSVPLAKWFRGPMGRAFEEDLARRDGIAASGLFDMAEVRILLDGHRRGLRDHSRSLWSCWMFDQFLRKVHNIHAVPIEAPLPMPREEEAA